MNISKTLSKEFIELAKVQNENEKELLQKNNVVGVALGSKITNNKNTGDKALQVLVRHKMDPDFLAKEDLVPKTVKGMKTDVIEVGEVYAGGPIAPDIDTSYLLDMDLNGGKFDGGLHKYSDEETYTEPKEQIKARRRPSMFDLATPQMLRQRIRPVQGGFSVGHHAVTAGTIATACYDWNSFPGMPQQYYILSNNHVLANSNNASIGDPILQPGIFDGGSFPQDMVGRLSRFIPIQFKTATTAPLNYVDAAIAEVPFHLADREIYWIGYVKDLYEAPGLDEILQKTGRTTNFTTGRVISVNATIDVNYGGGRIARFARQILTTNMSAGGDSGSLVTDLRERAVGLLFAGSNTVTVINNIYYVQRLLGIRLHEFDE